MELEANSFLYEILLEQVRRLARRNDARLLPFVEKVANVAWGYHPGRFADGSLENFAFRVGRQMTNSNTVFFEKVARTVTSRSRTLHVASSVHSAGGHSRVLTKWIQRDLSSTHGIVLTRQTSEVPEFLRKIWKEKGAAVTQLRAEDSIETRASQLRSLSAEYDRVILHTHPDDAVPVVAYARPGGCPVAMFNHAHFCFCLGSTVSDIIINTLPYYQRVSQGRRFSRATCLLTGMPGLIPLDGEQLNKCAAKRALGLPEKSPVAMTMAHELYFRPMKGYDFFGTMQKLTRLRPDLHLLIVGVSQMSPLVPEQLRKNERVRLVGLVAAPAPYYRAADLCFESFPMPSFGSLIESVAYGEAFPVPVYGQGETILRVNLDPVLKYEHRPGTEEEYLAYICRLLDSPTETREKAAALRKLLIICDETFAEQFGPLYREIDVLEHAPDEIPAAKYCAQEDDCILASYSNRDVGREINPLLPFSRATLAHLEAALRGHESKKKALARITSRGLAKLRRVIPTRGIKRMSRRAWR